VIFNVEPPFLPLDMSNRAIFDAHVTFDRFPVPLTAGLSTEPWH
jgi:hypothetical protein